LWQLVAALVLTSHTWENAKNERSHQDPAMAEAMLGEPAHVSRVLFPADYNTALAALAACYRTRGQVWTLVTPKAGVPDLFWAEQSARLLRDGAITLDWTGAESAEPDAPPLVLLTAVGAYQLGALLGASARLTERGIPHRVVYVVEPGRFRHPRGAAEARHVASEIIRARLWPSDVPHRLFVSHTRPETLLGTLGPLHTGIRTAGLGFINAGGTLDLDGMLFVNRCSWAHCVDAVARLLGVERRRLLDAQEVEALDGRRVPTPVIRAAPAVPSGRTQAA